MNAIQFTPSDTPETTAKCAETSLSLSPIEILLYEDRSVIAEAPKKALPWNRVEKRLVSLLRLDYKIYSTTICLIQKQGKDGAKYSYLGALGAAGTGLYPNSARGKKAMLKNLQFLLKNGVKYEDNKSDGNWQKELKPTKHIKVNPKAW